MFLLAISTVKPFINPYFLQYRTNAELIGFWPCSDEEDIWVSYFSTRTDRGRVVPVFYVPDMVFDDEDYKTVPPSPALFFKGNDDGHLGIHFENKEAAMKWLDECKHADFNELYKASCAGKLDVKLHMHN